MKNIVYIPIYTPLARLRVVSSFGGPPTTTMGSTYCGSSFCGPSYCGPSYCGPSYCGSSYGGPPPKADNSLVRVMRIKLKSYDSSSLVSSCSALIEAIRPSIVEPPGPRRGRVRLRTGTRKRSLSQKVIHKEVFGLRSLKGPIPLPNRFRKYCLLSSPHVNKTARDHYEIRVHKRLLYVEFYDKTILDRLKGVDILPGVQAAITYY